MKKLTKIKLINWMYFQNVTLEIKGNTMLTGTNASGKSTIIDAIQYVLVGNLKTVKFNTAADEVTKRTLESYVRGFVNDDHMKFLREGDVTSHIALEFENGEKSSIMGVVIDISSNHTKSRFYFVDDCFISDELFIESSKEYKNIRHYFDFKKHLINVVGKKIEEFNSVSLYQQKQRSYLGVIPDKYSKLLPKAIGFKSISRVESFVNDFLLDDSKVNIEGLRANITRLNSLQKTIEEEQEKLKKLNTISQEYDLFKRSEDRLRINNILYNKVQIEEMSFHIDDKVSQSKFHAGLVEELNRKQVGISESIKTSRDTITSIRVDLNQNSSYLTLKAIKDELNNVIFNQSQATSNYERLMNRLKSELEIIKSIRNYDSSQFEEVFSYVNNGNYSSENLRKVLIDYEEDQKSFRKNIENKEIILDSEHNEIGNDISATNKVIENLKRNRKPYPQYVNKLIDNISSTLYDKYGRNIIVEPVSDISEVVNEEWRDALEGYLNTQRFDLIIDPIYFRDALAVYDSIKKRENIYGVGIVDCIKYDENIEPLSNSLSEAIVSDNRYARNYLYTILNKVTKVDSINDLNKHKVSITKTCMTYRNSVARQIKNTVYQTPFIGTKANKILLEKKSNELIILKNRLDETQNRRTSVKNILSSLEKSNLVSLIDTDNPLISSIDQVKELKEERNRLEIKIDELGNDPSYIELSSKLSEEESNLEKLNIKKTDNDKSIGAHEEAIKNLNIAILEYKERLILLENEYENNIIKATDEKKINDLYAQFLQEKDNDFQLVKQKIENSNIQYNAQFNSSMSNLSRLMTEYNMLYNFGAVPSHEHYSKYMSVKDEIETNNLRKYINDLSDLKNKTNDIFRENFIQELRSKIRIAKDQIDHLNKVLKDKNFGEHKYQLKFTSSKNPEYAEYYKVILDEYNLDYDLFNDVLATKNKAIINRLFHKLTLIDEDKYAIDLLDYRKYIDVDIEIKSTTGKKMLSDVKHTQSGGESQVPFYIIAAASFQQILIRNRDKEQNLCVVLFDEAFNNMDSQRVSSMMKFYKELNIQIFLSLTGEKLHSIAKYVDSTIVIVRDGLVAEVMPFEGDFSD